MSSGYHQTVHVADQKLLMNVDCATVVFYEPNALMVLVLAALNVISRADIRDVLSNHDKEIIAHAVHKIEVVSTHRDGRQRAIIGVSPLPADQTIVSTNGEAKSVVEYFSERYKLKVRFPQLPCVNVGSERAGKEIWLPIEVCEVAPGQRCNNIHKMDEAGIILQASQPPASRQKRIVEHVRQSAFDTDQYLTAFGMKVSTEPETVNARVIEPPDVEYENASGKPANGMWSLRGKRLLEGSILGNWGIVITASICEEEIEDFVHKFVEVARDMGLTVEDNQPYLIHAEGSKVEQIMKTCFDQLHERNKGAAANYGGQISKNRRNE